MTALRLGISPCPNDTFIFGGLALGLVDAPPPGIDLLLSDVEDLNRLAVAKVPDICKVSANAVAELLDEYQVLRCGGAVVRGAGPLIVARRKLSPQELRNGVVAIPGERTTANMLLTLSGVHQGRRWPMLFTEVMDAVESGEAVAGVVIHESRFTYEERGLVGILDLGRWWEENSNLPLPLGVIVMRRSLGAAAAQAMERAIRASLNLARQNMEHVQHFIEQNAQEMETTVMARHIATYVDEHSWELGAEGEDAVLELLRRAAQARGDARAPESFTRERVFVQDEPFRAGMDQA